MIKVSKMADYAVVVLASLAEGEGNLMNAGQISGATGLPEPTVAKVLKLLARENILQSVRGAAGGYRLSLPPAEIPVARVIAAIDGPISLTSCVDGAATCSFENRCSVKGRWNGVNLAIKNALENVTLVDMLRKPVKEAA